MKKVLSLVLALVLVLGMVPVFANPDVAGSPGENLRHYGMLEGNQDGDLMLDATLNREAAAALFARLTGNDDDARAYTGPINFVDADEVSNWATGYVSYAVEAGWMVGVGGDRFNPKGDFTGQQLLLMLIRVLGYEEPVWSEVVDYAAELGLVVDATGLITRGQAFGTMWTAVSEVEMADGGTLLVNLGLYEEPAPVVTDLVVDNVVADNLKTITIMFNQEVDEDTLTAANIAVTRGATTLAATRNLHEDGKSVVVVLDNKLTQSDTIKVVVKNVETPAGDAVVEFEETIVVNDTKVPTVLSAEALNPKQILVKFSEPVQFSYPLFTLLNDIKIDGNAIIARTSVDEVNNTVLFTLSTALTEGTHSIEIKGIKDFADFTAPTATLTFTVVKDEEAPVAISAVVRTKSTVLVTFNEPVEVPGEFRINGNTVVTTSWNASKTQVTLTVPGDGLDIGAIVEVKVEYRNQEDIMGNKVAAWTTILTSVSDDATLPTVELTTVGTGNKLTLTFSKSMQTAGKVELLNANGVSIESINVGSAGATFKANSEQKVLEVTFGALSPINPGQYSIKISDMKDSTVRGNALAVTTIGFTAIDTLRPTVAATYVVTNHATDADKDTITIFFSEAMDVASVENLANYIMGGTPFTANANAVSAKAAADGKSVVITYKNARALTAPSTITVFAVKDLAGNFVSSTANTADLGVAASLTFTDATATDKNTVVVQFSTEIKSVSPATFVLVNSDGAAVTNFVSATVDSDDHSVVVFKTATAISTSAGIYNVKINAPTAISNIYNQNLTGYNTTTLIAGALIDEVAPELVSVVTSRDNDGVIIDNQIVFTFSEGMTNNAAGFRNNLVVKGTAGNILLSELTGASTVVIDGTKVTVTFGGADLDAIRTTSGNRTIMVSFPVGNQITDLAGNVLMPVADKEVLVKVVQ